jgi:hypothetical protein
MQVVPSHPSPEDGKQNVHAARAAAGGLGADHKQQTAATSTCVAVALIVALVAQGAVMALTYTLWPLFLRVHFGVDDDGFAPLLFGSSVASATAVLLAPSLQARLRGGALSVATFAACSAGLTTPATFAVQCPRSSLPMHTLLLLMSVASVALLDTSLKSAASELAPRSWQGSAFGVAASLSGIGSVTANIFGTVLYEHSFAEHSGLGESVAHSVLEHGGTLGGANSTADGSANWPCLDGGGLSSEGRWPIAIERVATGLGGLLPFHVVGALLLVAASGLALAR